MSLLDDIAAYWKLDEASGNALDAHSTNDLTETSGTIDSAAGKLGSARLLAAADTEYFARADNAALSAGDRDFTIAGWFYATSLGGTPCLVSKGWLTDGEYVLYYSGGWNFEVRSSGGSVTGVAGSGGGTTSTWHFIAVKHDSVNNVIGISINGGAFTTAAHSAGINDGAADFLLGAGPVFNGYFDGRMDGWGFWARAWSDADAAEAYNSGTGIDYPFSSITVDAPTLGFVSPLGDTLTVDWTAVGVTDVDIYLSVDNGSTFQFLIASGVDATLGTYDFTTLAEHESRQAVVKVVDSSDSSLFGVSDEFQIHDAHIAVLAPKAGDRLLVGDSVTIRWICYGPTAADVLLSLDGGATYSVTLATNVDSTNPGPSHHKTGTYSWTVLDTQLSTRAKIKVVDASDSTVFGVTGKFETSNEVPVVIIFGESNAYGAASNDSCAQAELDPTAACQLFNLDTRVFEDIEIGVNNVIDININATLNEHGFERAARHTAVIGGFKGNRVFVVKVTEPGTTCINWAASETRMITAVSAIGDAIAAIEGMGYTPVITYWSSIGLNDIQQGTTTANYKSTYIDNINTLRAAADGRFLMTKFSASAERDPYNAIMDEIAAELANVYAIETPVIAGHETDPYHWGPSDLITVTDSLLARTSLYGLTLTSALVAYWPGDEPSDDALDLVGTNTLAENGGTIVSGTGLVYSTARHLPLGGSRFLSCADNADLAVGDIDGWTLALWFKAASQPVSSALGSKDGAWYIRSDGASIVPVLYYNSGSAQTLTVGDYSTDEWNMLVVGFDGYQRYMRGSLNGGAIQTFGPFGGVPDTGTADFQLGADPTNTRYSDCLIGPAMFYRRALSEDEIGQLYNDGAGRTFERLVSSGGTGFIGGVQSGFGRQLIKGLSA